MTHDVAEDDFEPDYDLMRDFALELVDHEIVEVEPEPDDELILRLLSGTTRLKPNSPLVRYLTADEERESKKELAALLRSGGSPRLLEWKAGGRRRWSAGGREGLFNEVCRRLADLIDSDTKYPRKVVFAKPKGALEQHDRNTPVVHEVWELYTSRQFSIEEAVARAAAKYKLSESMVRKLWYSKPGKIYHKMIAMDLIWGS